MYYPKSFDVLELLDRCGNKFSEARAEKIASVCPEVTIHLLAHMDGTGVDFVETSQAVARRVFSIIDTKVDLSLQEGSWLFVAIYLSFEEWEKVCSEEVCAYAAAENEALMLAERGV